MTEVDELQKLRSNNFVKNKLDVICHKYLPAYEVRKKNVNESLNALFTEITDLEDHI